MSQIRVENEFRKASVVKPIKISQLSENHTINLTMHKHIKSLFKKLIKRQGEQSVHMKAANHMHNEKEISSNRSQAL